MTYFQKNSLIFLLLFTFIIAQDSDNQVYGFITDSTSGEGLIGANVCHCLTTCLSLNCTIFAIVNLL